MTIVTIQVGQCGNQIGLQFFTSLGEQFLSKNSIGSRQYQDFYQDVRERFYCLNSLEHLTARAILIDTEPKVIERAQQNAKKHGLWSYRKGRTFVRRQGAGNNWAQGYHRFGEEGFCAIGDIIAAEVESCDWLSGFLVLSSCAGGTGSGLGSRVIRLLREQYPSACILSQMVLPFNSGEVTVQSYNSILTLAHCLPRVDGLLLQPNDYLYNICTKITREKNVGLEQMNAVAVQQLITLVLQSFDSKWRDQNFADLLVQLVPSPVYKLLQMFSAPQESLENSAFSSYTWPGLVKDVQRQSLECAVGGHSPVQFSSLLMLRGQESSKVDASAIKGHLHFAPYLPESQNFEVFHHPSPVFQRDKTALLACNGQGLLPYLDRAVDRSWSMFCANAYLHHYARYGLTQDDFRHCFASLEKVIKKYHDLSGAKI